MLLYRTLFLLHALALAHAFGIQPHHLRVPAQRTISILDKMTNSSVNGACNFPSISVLQDFKTFAFFEECNKQLPTQFSPHTPPEDILCMGLYEIGMRLCSIITKYQLPLTVIPSQPSDFQKFISDPHEKETNAKLCSEFGSFPISHIQENENLAAWNTLQIFKNNPQACSQICLYINGDANELCRLILWGNKLFVDVSLRATKQTVQSLSMPKSSNSEIKDKSLSFPSENQNYRILQTDSEPQSPSQQEAPKDPSARVSSQVSSYENSQNSTPQKNVKAADDQKADSDVNTNDSKQHQVESLPEVDNTHVADQVDHPEPIYSSTDEKELPNDSENKKVTKPIKTNEGEAKVLKKEGATAKDLGSKKQDDVNRESNMGEQVVKVATSAVASPPASAPKAIAPEVPIAQEAPIAPEVVEDIVQDTASSPTVDQEPGNQETIGAEDLSKFDDPNLEQDEDEDMHFPPIGIDQPTKAEEAINGDDESLKPSEDIKYVHERFEESEDSHFFRFFMTMVVICILGYLLFHNKQKILALFLEGRSRRGTRRRPNTANYHKLDCNLEEAVSSPCSTSVAHVIY